MTPTPGTARLLADLGNLPGLLPRTDQGFPPTITWDDGPSGWSAARHLAGVGYAVTDPFWGGALADVYDLEPCVFQRVLRPQTAALLYLHAPEADDPAGDSGLAQRVFAADLPGEGYLPNSLEDELAVHLLLGELSHDEECDFGGDALFEAMGASVRRTFGGRRRLFEIARRVVI
ncbi:hypothetical protein [Actinoplanes sp. NPDC051851]|uniref:hypothetical protein n=1 Tax=Actinoplanes sp. NPDC051851 TaxID=3154753 RepID=UPI0034469ED2